MNIPNVQFEARLMGLKKTRDKAGDWAEARLQIHPLEGRGLFDAALGSRWQVVMVEIGDDEQPVKPGAQPSAAPAKPRSRTKSAVMACKDAEFQGWVMIQPGSGEPIFTKDPLGSTEDIAADVVRHFIKIQSRSELDTDEAAGKRWDGLWQDFIHRDRPQ